MTTSVSSMKATIAILREACPGVRVIVGGAVMTPSLAEYVGADHYAKDAMEAVRILGHIDPFQRKGLMEKVKKTEALNAVD